MGKVHFRSPGPASLPYTAKTGETIKFIAYVVNDNMPLVPGVVPDCVYCRLVVKVATDRYGKNIVDQAELEFNACCLYWSGEVTEVHGTLVMPGVDIWIGFFLYQAIEDKWVLVDSTVFFSIDNPDWPPFFSDIWTWKFLGLEFYKWIIIVLGGCLIGGLIIESGRGAGS